MRLGAASLCRFSSRASPVGPKRGWAGGRVERRQVVADDWAERWAIGTLATQGLHQHRAPGLGLHDHCQHHVVEVGPLIPPLTVGDVHDLVVRGLSAVRRAFR